MNDRNGWSTQTKKLKCSFEDDQIESEKKMDPLLENNTLIVSIRNTIFLNKNIGVYRISTSRLFLV